MVKLRTSLRQGFVAPSGYVWGSFDYSGMELRIAAGLSRDENMLAVFKKERDDPFLYKEDGSKYKDPMCDLHTASALFVFPELQKVPMWELASAAKDPGPTGVSKRSITKTINFGIIYGMQASSLAEDIGVSEEEAQSILERYFGRFRGLKNWLDTTANRAKIEKRITLPTGRVAFVAESNSKGVDDKNSLTRKACNGLVQGLGSEITKLALNYLLPIVESYDLVPISVVHDILYLCCG